MIQEQNIFSVPHLLHPHALTALEIRYANSYSDLQLYAGSLSDTLVLFTGFSIKNGCFSPAVHTLFWLKILSEIAFGSEHCQMRSAV